MKIPNCLSVLVDNVVGLIPDATRLLDRLVIDADRVNLVGRALVANISELRHNIDLAREEASRVCTLVL